MVFSVGCVCVFIGSHVSHQSGRVHQFDGNEFWNDCAGRSHFFPPDPGPRIAVFHRLYGERRRRSPPRAKREAICSICPVSVSKWVVRLILPDSSDASTNSASADCFCRSSQLPNC